MKRFSEAAVDDQVINDDLNLILLGALLQRQESGVLTTPEDLLKLQEMIDRIKAIDPVP